MEIIQGIVHALPVVAVVLSLVALFVALTGQAKASAIRSEAFRELAANVSQLDGKNSKGGYGCTMSGYPIPPPPEDWDNRKSA